MHTCIHVYVHDESYDGGGGVSLGDMSAHTHINATQERAAASMHLQITLHQRAQRLIRPLLLWGRAIGHHVLHACYSSSSNSRVNSTAALDERHEDVEVAAGG